MNDYAIAETAESMLVAGEIEPVIIVGFGVDMSFGVNSGETVSEFETATGKRFMCGRYSDFIIDELIPYIDSRYATDAARGGRFIDGYSMGGFSALHNAFLNPSLFSKVGGHSPSLFVEDFPRQNRIRLALSDAGGPGGARPDLHRASCRPFRAVGVFGRGGGGKRRRAEPVRGAAAGRSRRGVCGAVPFAQPGELRREHAGVPEVLRGAELSSPLDSTTA